MENRFTTFSTTFRLRDIHLILSFKKCICVRAKGQIKISFSMDEKVDFPFCVSVAFLPLYTCTRITVTDTQTKISVASVWFFFIFSFLFFSFLLAVSHIFCCCCPSFIMYAFLCEGVWNLGKRPEVFCVEKKEILELDIHNRKKRKKISSKR